MDDIHGSGICDHLCSEYKKQIKSQISSNITEVLDALQSHKNQLLQLCSELNAAKNQITTSAKQSEEKVISAFDSLEHDVLAEIIQRKNDLLAHIELLQTEALKPLSDCEFVIKDQISDVDSKISYGANLSSKMFAISRETVSRFQEESTSMTDLPEVPSLVVIPNVTVEFTDATVLRKKMTDLIEEYATVYRMGPVQITYVHPRPGGLLVNWEEISDDGEENREFCLQASNAGVTDESSATFQTVYTGCDYSHVIRNVKCCENYLLRVASRAEGRSSWSPWSTVCSASTSVPHFRWKDASAISSWRIGNDGKLVSKDTSGTDMIFSDGPQLTCGSSLLFKVIECNDTACQDEGFGLSWEEVMSDVVPFPGSVFINFAGKVFLDGISRLTQLPSIGVSSEVVFTLEKLSEDKVRMHIEHSGKQVSYDWKKPGALKELQLFFFARVTSPNWKLCIQ